jgi:hypothetical protein
MKHPSRMRITAASTAPATAASWRCRPVLNISRVVALGLLAVAGLSTYRRAAAQDTVQDASRYHTAMPRFGGYIGVPDLWTPSQSLQQIGIHAEFGMYLRPRLLFGADYSHGTGDTALTAAGMPAALQQQLDGEVAALISLGLLPPGYVFRLPLRATTNAFSMGPQVILLERKRLSVFGNPALGALREEGTPLPKDPLQTSVAQIELPSGHKIDWTPFYGGSGGVEVPLTHGLGLRTIIDIIYSHPFNDLVANGVWTYRFSAGISYRLGHRRAKD